MFGFLRSIRKDLEPLDGLIDKLTDERNSYRTSYEAANQIIAEKEIARAKAVEANSELFSNWKKTLAESNERLAEINRLTACVAERDMMLDENSKCMETLTETVRLAELNLDGQLNQNNELLAKFDKLQEAFISATDEIGCNRRDITVLESAKQSADEKIKILTSSIHDTHLALVSVIDDMDCPDDDGELPILGSTDDEMVASIYQRHAAAIQLTRECAKIERKLNAPFNDIPQAVPVNGTEVLF